MLEGELGCHDNTEGEVMNGQSLKVVCSNKLKSLKASSY